MRYSIALIAVKLQENIHEFHAVVALRGKDPKTVLQAGAADSLKKS
jgi:hypothetical protein